MTVNAANQKISVTWRAVIIGLLLIPLNAVWIMQMEAVYYSAHSTLIALFFNVVCNILILILLNIPLRKLSPNLAFKPRGTAHCVCDAEFVLRSRRS